MSLLLPARAFQIFVLGILQMKLAMVGVFQRRSDPLG